MRGQTHRILQTVRVVRGDARHSYNIVSTRASAGGFVGDYRPTKRSRIRCVRLLVELCPHMAFLVAMLDIVLKVAANSAAYISCSPGGAVYMRIRVARYMPASIRS
jgi:hypothetical protein